MSKVFDINNSNIYDAFSEYLLKLNIQKNIRYFECIQIVNNHLSVYNYYLELDDIIRNEIHTCFHILAGYMIIPLEETYISMVHLQIYQCSGPSYSSGLNLNRLHSTLINYLRGKQLLQEVIPNCNHGSSGVDLINEINRNQDFYNNEMKKKNIITELNDINVNYCNKINNLESKLLEQINKNKELEKIFKNLGSCQKDKMIVEILQSISFLREMNDDAIDILKNENNKLKDELENNKKFYVNELSKKDKLNKRLVNLLTIYKYHELNNVQKYNYEEIKEKNKKLNSEFKRVAKLMKLDRLN